MNLWLSQLGAGYNQAAALNMAAALDTSSLYYFGVNGLINRTYVALLGRSAQPFEISYWMANYTTTQNLIAAITDTHEYFRGKDVPVSGKTYSPEARARESLARASGWCARPARRRIMAPAATPAPAFAPIPHP